MEVMIRSPPVCASPLPTSTRSRRFSRLHVRWSDAAAPPCNQLVTGQRVTTIRSSSVGDLQNRAIYEKSVPEVNIQKPVGSSLKGNLPCFGCESRGVVLCTTCSGSGLYVDAILESQGVIVQVKCLGCGGAGNIMCSECGGRGHLQGSCG